MIWEAHFTVKQKRVDEMQSSKENRSSKIICIPVR